MRAWWCALLLLVAVLPGVEAGSAEIPEVTDPAGDVAGPGGVPACPSGCAGAPLFVDLVSGWAAQDAEGTDDLVLRIDSGNNANAYGSVRYDFHFDVGGTTYMAGMQAAASNTAGGLPGSGAQSPRGVASSAAWDSTIITITVPLSAIGDPGPGEALTGLYMTSAMLIQGQTSFTDRAPNSGFGTDYILVGPASGGPSVNVTHVNVTSGPLEHLHFSNATGNASYLINWTAPANVTLAWSVQGNGTVNITLMDAAGVQQYACLCSNGTNVTQALNGTAGVWRASVNYTAFWGSARLALHETVAVPEANDPADAEQDGGGNETLDGGGQDTPLPFIASALGLVLAAAARRRR